jgi:hypothetical protein
MSFSGMLWFACSRILTSVGLNVLIVIHEIILIIMYLTWNQLIQHISFYSTLFILYIMYYSDVFYILPVFTVDPWNAKLN